MNEMQLSIHKPKGITQPHELEIVWIKLTFDTNLTRNDTNSSTTIEHTDEQTSAWLDPMTKQNYLLNTPDQTENNGQIYNENKTTKEIMTKTLLTVNAGKIFG